MSSESNPGQVPPDAFSAGESISRRCEGSGRVDGGKCPDRGGTGKVGVSGA